MTSRIRIGTGLVLFVFVLLHLVTIAFGLASISAMEAARVILMAPFTNPVGGPLLLLSFLVHGGLGLWTIYRRNTLLMTWQDGSQAVLGMAIVPLLLPHIMGVGVGPVLTGTRPTFEWVLAVYWLYAPGLGLQQVLALVVVWVHGCYGLLLWLQIQERLGWISGLVWPLVVAMPIASLLGFVEAGKFLYENRNDPELMAPVREQAAAYDQVGAQLWSVHDTLLWIYGGILLVVLIARAIRVRRQAGLVDLHYGDRVSIKRAAGLNLLEMARLEQVPHASLCGARGRCGSCAVRVLEGAENLSPIAPMEAQSLARTLADDDMRLACQAMPARGRVVVDRVYDPQILPGEYRAQLRQRRVGPPQVAAPPAEPPEEAPEAGDVPITTDTGEARA